MKDYSDLMKLVDPKERNPFEILKKYINTNYDSTAKQFKDEKKRIWTVKLSRYLTYCVNGGLMGKKFNFKKYFGLIDTTT
jgi:hypothetical protein